MSTPCAACGKVLASHEVTIGVREGFGFPAISSYQLQFALCLPCAHELVTGSTPGSVRRTHPSPFRRRSNGQTPAPPLAAPTADAGGPAPAPTSEVAEKKKR